MKVNFDITDNHALTFNGRLIDLHNNFDFVRFDYAIKNKQLNLFWTKSSGDWVDKNELNNLLLIHKNVQYFTVQYNNEKSNIEDRSCLSEISYFPSSAREVNSSIIPQTKPKEGDDILYFFENGQLIRVNCKEVELAINS